MSQDLKREREMGTEQEFLGNTESPVWRSVAQLESRNSALKAEVAKLKAQLAEKSQGRDFATEAQEQKARAEGLESKLLRLKTYVNELDTNVIEDERWAMTPFVPDGTDLRDNLFSRYQAANRAGVARRIVKGIRELLALPDEPKPATKYWKIEPRFGAADYYKLNPAGHPVYWSTTSRKWLTSSKFTDLIELGTVATPVRSLPMHIVANLPDGEKP